MQREGKEALRERARAIRSKVSEEAAAKASEAVSRELIEAIDWSKARSLLAYAPIQSEIDPSGVVEAFWRRGRAVAFPAVEPKARRLLPRRATSWAELRPGPYGIPEPSPASPALPARAIDVVLIPGLAFDRRGYRLGYGGGYYDRFLPHLRPGALKVGLTYAELLWDALPVEPHDQAVDWVATEEGIHRCLASLGE